MNPIRLTFNPPDTKESTPCNCSAPILEDEYWRDDDGGLRDQKQGVSWQWELHYLYDQTPSGEQGRAVGSGQMGKRRGRALSWLGIRRLGS